MYPITRLALLVFEPGSFAHHKDKTADLSGRIRWVDLPHDPAAFHAFLAEVMQLLNGPAPTHSRECTYSAYVSRRMEMLAASAH